MRRHFHLLTCLLSIIGAAAAGHCQERVSETLEPELQDGIWHYVDRAGRSVFENSRISIPGTFSEGLAPVKISEKWVYLAEDGQPQWNKTFDLAQPFQEGLAAVKVGNVWGYINHSGTFSIQPKFEDASGFSEDLAAVQIRGKWRYIKKTGTVVPSDGYLAADRFSEGLAAIRTKDKWGYIDKAGRLAIPDVFDAAQPFSEGLAAIEFADRWGYINRNGKPVIDPKYEIAQPYSEGLATVRLPEDKGGGGTEYINRSGDKAFDETFKSASSFSGGLAIVKDLLGVFRTIDKNGNSVGQPGLRSKLTVQVLSAPQGAKVFMVPLYDWEIHGAHAANYFLANRARLLRWQVQDGPSNVETLASEQRYMVVFLRREGRKELKAIVGADFISTKPRNRVFGILR